jgi:hypothetical protein
LLSASDNVRDMIIIRLQQSSLFKHRCFDLFLSHTDVCLVVAHCKAYCSDPIHFLSIESQRRIRLILDEDWKTKLDYFDKKKSLHFRCFDLFLSHTDVCLVDAISKTTNYWNNKQFLLSITIINAIIKYNTMYKRGTIVIQGVIQNTGVIWPMGVAVCAVNTKVLVVVWSLGSSICL